MCSTVFINRHLNQYKMTNIFKNENASKQNQTFSTTYELFKNITIENAGDSFGSDDIEDVGTGRSSSLDCNDIHSVFAFLAFLFALLNFVLNMVFYQLNF